MRINTLQALALVCLVAASGVASATTFSMSTGWSNTMNPNGPWSYNQGNTPQPLVNPWDGAGSAFAGCKQRAWAPSDNSGNFLPALMKPNTCTAKAMGIDPNNGKRNVLAGDIVVHTVDHFNGNPSLGVANILFTLPAGQDGHYLISGFVWDAWLLYGTTRPQDWVLLVNGVQQASGTLSGLIPRSQAQKFRVSVNLVAGDTVDLQLIEDPNAFAGFLVGARMTIRLQ